MAFKTSTQKVASKQLLKLVETKVNGRITLEGERCIDRVLEGVGVASVTAEEKMGDYFQFAGSVNLTILFTNGEKEVDSEKLAIDFSEKVNIVDLESSVVIPEITAIKVQKESDKSASVVVTLKSKIYGAKAEELQLISGEEDGYYQEVKEVRVDNLSSCGTSQFSLMDELTINGDISKILYTNSAIIVNKVTPKDNYAIVDGTANIDVIYLSEGQVKKVTKSIDFNQEVASLNLTPEMMAFVDTFEKNVICTLNKNEENDKNVISLEISIGYALWAYTKSTYNLISDVFSEDDDVAINVSTLNSKIINEPKNLSDRQTVVVDMLDRKRMDEIISIGKVNNILEQVTLENGKIVIRGGISASVIYKNYDSEDILSTLISAPFELKFQDGELPNGAYVEGKVVSRCDGFKNKAGKDISLTIDYDVEIFSHTSDTESYVSKIEKIGVIAPTENSIIVYKPNKGERVFDIAKELRISPDIILAQNPQIEDGRDIEKVVIYKRMN